MSSSGKIVLPNSDIVEFEYSGKMHLPNYLKGRGVQAYEPVTLSVFLACVEMAPGDIFDIGANIGIYALSAASSLGRKVVAFEPFPRARAVLEDIVGRHGYAVEVRPAAVGAAPGQATFYLSARSDMSNSLNENFRRNRHAGEVTVEVASIDQLLGEFAPAVIKIDTESTEADVFRGATALIAQNECAFIVEILNDAMMEQMKALIPSGYRFVPLGSPSTELDVGDVSDLVREGDSRNFLIVPTSWDMAAISASARSWLDRLRALPVP